MSQALSPGRFVSGISLTPTLEPESMSAPVVVEEAPKKTQRKKTARRKRVTTPAEPTSARPAKEPGLRAKRLSKPVARAECPLPPAAPVKKSHRKPLTVADIQIDLSDSRMSAFCSSVHISTDQPLKMGIIDAWTSHGHIMFRAIGEKFEAIFKCTDNPLMSRMLVYGCLTPEYEPLTFPSTTEPFLTPEEITDLFHDRTLRIST